MCHKRANSASALRPRGMTLNVLLMYLREELGHILATSLVAKMVVHLCVECESHSPHCPFALNGHSTRDMDKQM